MQGSRNEPVSEEKPGLCVPSHSPSPLVAPLPSSSLPTALGGSQSLPAHPVLGDLVHTSSWQTSCYIRSTDARLQEFQPEPRRISTISTHRHISVLYTYCYIF